MVVGWIASMIASHLGASAGCSLIIGSSISDLNLLKTLCFANLSEDHHLQKYNFKPVKNFLKLQVYDKGLKPYVINPIDKRCNISQKFEKLKKNLETKIFGKDNSTDNGQDTSNNGPTGTAESIYYVQNKHGKWVLKTGADLDQIKKELDDLEKKLTDNQPKDITASDIILDGQDASDNELPFPNDTDANHKPIQKSENDKESIDSSAIDNLAVSVSQSDSDTSQQQFFATVKLNEQAINENKEIQVKAYQQSQSDSESLSDIDSHSNKSGDSILTCHRLVVIFVFITLGVLLVVFFDCMKQII